MESRANSVIKDVLILCVITIIAGAALGFVNQLTQGIIEDQKLSSKTGIYQSFYPDADNFKYDDTLTASVNSVNQEIDSLDFGNVYIDEAVQALDAAGHVTGYIITVTTADGYGGAIEVAAGITADGTVAGIDMLEINETAGLGMKANDPAFKDQYAGKNVGAFDVIKGEINADHEIQAISGATITSNAVTNAVNAAIYFYQNYIGR